jgi:hypothetical protein
LQQVIDFKKQKKATPSEGDIFAREDFLAAQAAYKKLL